jgi:glycosyltransferase involved in cell wall biosynthesis
MGHKVFVACSLEKRSGLATYIEHTDKLSILRIETLNITQNNNYLDKGLALLSLESKFNKAINSYFHGIAFDLILYSTPPITFVNLIKRFKKRNNAISYLLLKDIFPQNAVDLKLIIKWSPLWIYFRHLEKQLYKISDFIGCMSAANVRYLLDKNPSVAPDKVEECPNSIKINHSNIFSSDKSSITREKFGIPDKKLLLLYGGNLGKPQGIDFLIKILHKIANHAEIYFLIIGDGSEYSKISDQIDILNANNIKLISRVPSSEYSEYVKICDIGLIFLDHRFTIPNFPSRLLTYLSESKAVIAATDTVSDVGTILESSGSGYFIPSDDIDVFQAKLKMILADNSKLKEMGANAYKLLLEKYTVEKSYSIIMQHFQDYKN